MSGVDSKGAGAMPPPLWSSEKRTRGAALFGLYNCQNSLKIRARIQQNPDFFPVYVEFCPPPLRKNPVSAPAKCSKYIITQYIFKVGGSSVEIEQ